MIANAVVGELSPFQALDNQVAVLDFNAYPMPMGVLANIERSSCSPEWVEHDVSGVSR